MEPNNFLKNHFNYGTQKGLFLDLDHTVIRPKNGNTFPVDCADWEYLPGIVEKIIPYLQSTDYEWRVCIVSNQGGIEAGFHKSHEIATKICKVLEGLCEAAGVDCYGRVAFDYCPALNPEDPDRKPNPGLILGMEEKFGIHLPTSLMVGDMDSDREAAKRAGVKYLDINEFLQL